MKKCKLIMLVVISIGILFPTLSVEAADGNWVKTEKGWKYGETEYRNQWSRIEDQWYYFDNEGVAVINQYINGCWLNANGSFDNAYSSGTWHSDEIGWWYEDNGWYPSHQELKIDGISYWFDDNGYCNGYVDENGTYVYLNTVTKPSTASNKEVTNYDYKNTKVIE